MNFETSTIRIICIYTKYIYILFGPTKKIPKTSKKTSHIFLEGINKKWAQQFTINYSLPFSFHHLRAVVEFFFEDIAAVGYAFIHPGSQPPLKKRWLSVWDMMYIYIYICIPGTQMTLVLIGIQTLFWRAFWLKIEDIHRFLV